MKRTCLHKNTNTHENESCEFHPTTKETNYLRVKNNTNNKNYSGKFFCLNVDQ